MDPELRAGRRIARVLATLPASAQLRLLAFFSHHHSDRVANELYVLAQLRRNDEDARRDELAKQEAKP